VTDRSRGKAPLSASVPLAGRAHLAQGRRAHANTAARRLQQLRGLGPLAALRCAQLLATGLQVGGCPLSWHRGTPYWHKHCSDMRALPPCQRTRLPDAWGSVSHPTLLACASADRHGSSPQHDALHTRYTQRAKAQPMRSQPGRAGGAAPRARGRRARRAAGRAGPIAPRAARASPAWRCCRRRRRRRRRRRMLLRRAIGAARRLQGGDAISQHHGPGGFFYYRRSSQPANRCYSSERSALRPSWVPYSPAAAGANTAAACAAKTLWQVPSGIQRPSRRPTPFLKRLRRIPAALQLACMPPRARGRVSPAPSGGKGGQARKAPATP